MFNLFSAIYIYTDHHEITLSHDYIKDILHEIILISEHHQPIG